MIMKKSKKYTAAELLTWMKKTHPGYESFLATMRTFEKGKALPSVVDRERMRLVVDVVKDFDQEAATA